MVVVTFEFAVLGNFGLGLQHCVILESNTTSSTYYKQTVCKNVIHFVHSEFVWNRF